MADLERTRAVKRQAEATLMQIPGVTGVDVGFKQVNGAPTETLAIRVFVSNKRDVPPAEAIPAEIEGVPVDVIERRFTLH